MFRLNTGPCTRVENLTICIDVDKRQLDRVHELVKTILQDEPPTPGNDDTLKVTYTLVAEYYGTVEKRLEAILTLLNKEPGVTVHVDSNLLDGTTCLLARVVEKLRLIQSSLAPREA
jgi:hypothetical protein